MNKARIEMAPPPYPEDIDKALSRPMPGGNPTLKLFRIMAQNPTVFRRIFAGSFLNKGEISLLDREIVVQRTCAQLGCEYEWGVHTTFFADKSGLGLEKTRATASAAATDPIWSDREATLIRMVDSLVARALIPDQLWTELTHYWSDSQLIELIALSGFYHVIGFLANGLQIPLEDFAEKFPPAA